MHSAQQTVNFLDLQVLKLPGWLHSLKDPLRDTQPTAPFSQQAPPDSQTDKPYPAVRPARRKPHLQQLQTQSIEAYTCVFGPLVLAVEAGRAARKQKRALSSPQAPSYPETPDMLQELNSSREKSFWALDSVV